MTMQSLFTLHPVGVVRQEEGGAARLEIFAPYRPALFGMQEFSHVHVLWWFHENDHAEGRTTLQVHPRRNPDNPLTGVFATHSPLRPNLIGLTLCRVLSVDMAGGIVALDRIDARDGSPVIDIKSYFPYDTQGEVAVPSWR
jgi:tRNA-Thr(GGU) m(6)t(6)A37 methyltransferase TsaA